MSVGQRLHGLHSHPHVQQLCCPLTRPTVLGEWTPSFRALIKILWCQWAGLWLPAAINPSFRKSPRYTLVSSVKFKIIKSRTLRTMSCGCPPLDALINVLMILIAIATDFTPSFLSHWANERVKILFPCPSFYFYYFCAGRASVTPSLDVLITLLSLGEKGYRRLCVERKASTRYFALYVYVMSCSFITGKLQVPQREAN